LTYIVLIVFYLSSISFAENFDWEADNISGVGASSVIGDFTLGSSDKPIHDIIAKGPWVDVRAGFGFVGDGVADDNDALLAAIALSEANEVPLYLPSGTIITSSTLTFSTTPYVLGKNTVIRYTGTESAIKLMGKVDLIGLMVQTTADAANGIEFTTGTQLNYVLDVSVEATAAGTSTGKGLFFNATASFLYGTDLNRVRSIRYKYPLYVHGANLSDNTINQITGRNLQLHCYSASVSGSTGIYFDNGAHGIGSDIAGGSIESCDTGIYVADVSYGLSYRGDIESVNTPYTVGNQFTGTIEPITYGEYFRSHAASGTWFKYKNHEAQDAYYENYYDHSFVSYYASGGQRNLSYYIGPSLIDGGSPQFIAGFYGTDAAENDYNTYLKIKNRKIAFYSETPQNDNVACTVGDIVLNSGSDNVLGWKCTATTPTWKAMTITLAP